ncbi:MAG: patatin-like phospholipase family protein, partial [Treponema sp.]|nr:patatin-like phospholipase family protein [Treponema sp.]
PIEYTGVTVDGGGILGIGPAKFLAKLNYQDESFLAGTSTGSIIVALRGAGKSWEEICEMFEKEGPGIFKKPPLLWRLNPQKPKYDAAHLESTLKYYLGDMKMKDLKKPVFITTSDFLRGKPKVFDNTDDEMVRYAVRCSTAAPTYFTPVDGRYADGGLWSNNPALVGLAGFCKQTRVNQLRCRIMSFGTGGDGWQAVKIGNSMNVLQWASPIIQYALAGTEEAPAFIAKALLDPRRFLRISPKLNRVYSLDSIDSMAQYSEIWSEWEKEYYTGIWEWIEGRPAA